MVTMNQIFKQLIPFVIGGIIVAILMRKCGDGDKQKVNLYEGLQDTIRFYKDKEGKTHATIKTLQVENINNLLDIRTKDKEILELQALVVKYRNQLRDDGSATILGTETNITKTTSTTVVPISSTLSLQGNSLVCNPTYSTSYKDEWIEYEILMNKDSTNFGFNSKNKYSIVIGSERENKWKLWQKKKSFVDVTNENPYDKTKTLRTVNIKQKKERFSIGIQGGFGVTIYGLSPYIGIGGQFKLISL